MTASDIDRLQRYDWPGNVRELENVIERAVILASNGRLRINLPNSDAGVRSAKTRVGGTEAATIVTEAERRRRDRENIEAALQVTQGRIFGADGAAELLGIPPTTLMSRMKSYGLARGGRQRE